MTKRILTFFLAVLMLMGSIVPVFAEEADVVVHEPVMADSVDLGKREMANDDVTLGEANKVETDEPVAEEVEADETTEAEKLVKVAIKFVDTNNKEIAKTLTKEYALGGEKTIKAPNIKGYIKKGDVKTFTVTEGLEVELVYEKVKTDEAVMEDTKAETDELEVAGVEVAEPVGAEDVDASLFTFEGTVLTGLSDKGQAMVDAKLAAGEEVTLTVPSKTDAGENVAEIADNAFRELGVNFTLEANDKLISIGDHAFFKNKITSLDLNVMTSLVEVKDYAFAHNELNGLVLPGSITNIGAYAFRDNLLKELYTKNIETIGEGAFSDNRLEKLVFGDALTSIGNHAFEQNALIEVEIGDNVQSIGESAFAFNGRYVKINTENEIVKNEKVYRGYGHVVNPVKITVKYINAETGESILDDKVLGDDLTDINAVFNIGEENTFVPEKIKGYWINDEVKFTPDKTDYTLTLRYTPTNKKPTIEGANIRMIALNEEIGEKELLSFIKATDLTGKDISDRVTVSPKTLATSTGGVKKVTYTVTDEFGNSSVVDIELPVAINWNNYPIGNGWMLGDFEYKGNEVTGFSEQGKEKVQTNKGLIVPSFVPRDGVINVNELEKVTSIGANAFMNNQLTEVVIPDKVTRIGDSAFAKNHLTEVVIPDKVTSIGNGAFENNQLTSVVIGNSVTSIGYSAFRGNQLINVVIPDSVTRIGDNAFRDNQLKSVTIGNSVTSIADWAFENNQLTELVISDKVTSIGGGAFRNNQLTELVIPDKVTRIGDSAFAKNHLTEVVIPDKVTSIGNGAFENNQLTSVVIGNSVTSIGYSAFRGNQLTSVVIGNSVTSIGREAFENNQLTEVVIPDSVTSIGSSAFAKNHLTEVVIPDSVTSIADWAFYGNQLTSVVIGNSVTSIADWAFYGNQLTSVVIGNSVTSIGREAFYNNQLTSVVIPDKVTRIGDSAFRYNTGMDDKHNVYLFTPSRTNPNKLKSVPGQYLINPTELKLNFVDEEGHNMYKSNQSVVSSGSIVDLPNVLGYRADTVKETGEKITDNKFTFISNTESGVVERTVIYKKTKISPVDGLKLATSLLKSTNKNPYKYYIGTDQRLNVSLNVLKDVPNIKNSNIAISLPQEIDETSIKVPSHYNIKDYKIENNTLFINLQNITRNTSLEIPVLFKLNKYTTPENTDLTIKTTIKDSQGKYIHEVLENTFTGFYKKPSMAVLADNSNGFEYSYKWQDGPRAVGEFEVVNNDTSKTRVKTPYDFEYGFDISTPSTSDSIERNIESYKIAVELPNYTALDDGGNEKTLDSVFKDDLNKGWAREGNKLIYKKDGLNTNSPEMPKLFLSFPKAKNGTDIKLSSVISFKPKNQGKEEDLISINDDITIKAYGRVKGGEGYLNIYPRDTRWATGVHYYLYNNSIDRHKLIPWDVYTDPFSKDKEVKNLDIKLEKLTEKNMLADQYDIKSIELIGDKALNFKIYNKGELVDAFKLDKNNKNYKLKNQIDNIRAVTDDGDIITKTIGFRLNTYAKHPDRGLVEDTVRLSGTSTSDIKNGYQKAYASNSMEIVPFGYELKARIKNRDSDKSYVASDIVKFNVGLEDVVNEEYNHQEFLTEDLNNFKELVVLPKNALIKSVKLSDDFKNAIEPSYEVLDLGNGVNGILFKAKSLNKKTYDIADVKIATNSSMLDASHTADVYATWNNPEVAKYKEKDSPIKALDGQVTSDSSPFVLATVKSVYSEKYVKDKGMLAYSTVSKDGNVEYLLRISNTSDNARNNVTIVDILPYIGDDKGSEINVSLKEAINLPGAKISYTTEKAPTTESNFTEGFREGITAVKIEKDAINSGETFEVNLKGKIELPEDLQGRINMTGKLGWNDFWRKDDLTDTFVATDKVSVEYSLPNASIEFVKYGLKKSIFFNSYKKVPLSGAEFELRDIDGNFIKSAISGSDGKVVFNDVDVKDYIIKEVKAPKRYELSADKRVSAEDFKLIGNNIVASLNEEVINESLRYGNLTINKTTKADTPLSAIEFRIIGIDEANSNYEKIVKTDAEGKAYLNKIPEGNYRVEEIENDKWVPAEAQTFKIEQTQGDQIDADQEINLKFVNDKYKFKLNKAGYSNNEDLPQDLTNINLFNRGFVAGATFKINGEKYTTDAKGNITLPVDTGSTITVEEVKAPNGYILNKQKVTLKLTDDGQLLNQEGKPYNGNMLYFPNKLKEVKGKITINKVDPDGKSLAGAKFMLYKVEGLKETPLGEYTSNQNGKLNIVDLKPGTYKLVEVSAPDGYYHDKWEKIITVPETPKDLEAKTQDEAATLRTKDSYDFYTTDDTSFTREIGYKVVNKKLNVSAYKYEKVLSNVDAKDIDQYNNKAGYKVIKSGDKYSVVKAIPNVKFNFYEGDTLIDTLVSGKDGYVDFKGYVFNENKDYKLVEIEAPEEYKVDKAPIRISISKLKALDNFDGNIKLEIENKPIKGKIVISKYDAKTRLVLPGQEFTLYDSDGKKIVSKVTNEAGLIEFGDLNLKTYTFKETAVKGEYFLDENEYKASLSILSPIHVIKVFNKPILKVKDVIVKKTNDKGEPLEGVEFSIFKNSKRIYGPVKTNSRGIAVFKDVEIEDGLELRETRSLEGYRLNPNKVNLDMNQDKVEAKFTNYKTEQLLPDTGTRGFIPYALVAVALLGIGYTVSRKTKQK